MVAVCAGGVAVWAGGAAAPVGAAVVVAFTFGAFLHCWTMKPVRQFVWQSVGQLAG